MSVFCRTLLAGLETLSMNDSANINSEHLLAAQNNRRVTLNTQAGLAIII